MGWLDKALKQVDYLTRRFEAFFVETEADRADCMEILEEVRRNELRRVTGSSVLESASFADVEVDDLLLACRDTRSGKIIGCVRSTRADQLASIPSSVDEYCLDLFTPEQLKQTGIATRLALRKAHRKSIASFVLLEKMYSEGLARGYLFCLLSCEPGLYHSYARLGFRPIGPVHPSDKGGFRIPMLIVNHDRDYLEEVDSPLASALRRAPHPRPVEGVRWYRDLIAREGAIDVGIAPFSDTDSEVHRALTEGLSEDGIAALLTNAMTIDCAPGQEIVRQGDGGKFMGFVVDGLVEVRRGSRLIAVLGEGELFGEVEATLGTERTAHLVAADDHTRVLLLSQSAVSRVADDDDRIRLWQNIARQLARRVAAMTHEPTRPAETGAEPPGRSAPG